MNFLIRTITAILYAALMLFCIQKGGVCYFGLFLLVTILAANEFATLANRHKGCRINRLLSILPAALFYLATASFTLGSSLYTALSFAAFLCSIIIVTVNELYAKKDSPVTEMAYTLLPVLYIALPMSLMILLGYALHHTGLQTEYSPALPLMLFLCIWANDAGAYCTGCTIGRHKLFERVSPKKTWEGSIGGAVFTIAVAGMVSHYVPSLYSIFPLPVWLGMGLTIVVFGTWGDLVESLMKREMGIKDSGRILPGHGGILDRFDSSLLAIPAVTIYFALVMTFC